MEELTVMFKVLNNKRYYIVGHLNKQEREQYKSEGYQVEQRNKQGILAG